MTTSIPEGEMGSIALIEPHDGEIESVSIALDGAARVQFTKLAVYHGCAPERYEIWTYRAVLEIRGAYELALRGQPEEGFDDYVDDAVVSASDAEIVNWNELLASRPANQIQIVFGSGRTLEIGCCDARLLLEEAIRHVEDWTGPLFSDSPTK